MDQQEILAKLKWENHQMRTTLMAIGLHYQHPIHDHNWAHHVRELVDKCFTKLEGATGEVQKEQV